jgi:hypothetical protein
MLLNAPGIEIDIWKDETREDYLFDEITMLSRKPELDLASTSIAIRITGEKSTRTVLIRAFGFSSGRSNSGVLLGNLLIVAVGNRVCGLEVPRLAVKWHVEADPSAVFGVHEIPGVDIDVIVHGELELLRLSTLGEVRWRSGGKDILTGDLQFIGESIVISDFEGNKYRFHLTDGRSELLK